MVSQEGKVNFNSIHVNNKYRQYIGLCYFIRLENYLRMNYDKEFYFRFIFNWICSIYNDMPKWAVYKLISISSDKLRYMKYIMLIKLSSDNHIEMVKGIKKITSKKKRVVIFGAGECARLYLDSEGWREQVLFIVDNDAEKHGKSFKGYLIKKPEAILPIKDKVSILIANEFHEKEIVDQLEKMGINNYHSYCDIRNNSINKKIADKLKKSLASENL
jgi:FlaA1/EpsC-like NDP-sugar epimerase